MNATGSLDTPAKSCLIPFGWMLGGRQRRLFSQRLFISLFGSRLQRDYYMNFIILVIPLPSCKLLFLKVEEFSRNDNDFYCIFTSCISFSCLPYAGRRNVLFNCANLALHIVLLAALVCSNFWKFIVATESRWKFVGARWCSIALSCLCRDLHNHLETEQYKAVDVVWIWLLTTARRAFNLLSYFWPQKVVLTYKIKRLQPKAVTKMNWEQKLCESLYRRAASHICYNKKTLCNIILKC
jgi:hypothetical protein